MSPRLPHEPDPRLVERLELLLRGVWSLPVEGSLPEDFETLPAFADGRLLLDAAPLPLPLVPAPAELTERLASRLGFELAGPRAPRRMSAAWPGARRSRMRMPALSAVLLAACLVIAVLLGNGPAHRAPTADKPPRLVIVDVTRPHDWSLDPAAFSLYLSGGLDGAPQLSGEDR